VVTSVDLAGTSGEQEKRFSPRLAYTKFEKTLHVNDVKIHAVKVTSSRVESSRVERSIALESLRKRDR